MNYVRPICRSIRHRRQSMNRASWPSATHGSRGKDPVGFRSDGASPGVVMVAGYSRCISAPMLRSQSAADLITGHWRRFNGLVPLASHWSGTTRGGWSGRADGPRVTDEFAAFAGLLGIRSYSASPVIRKRRAWSSGRRLSGGIQLPARAVFSSPLDFNIRLAD